MPNTTQRKSLSDKVNTGSGVSADTRDVQLVTSGATPTVEVDGDTGRPSSVLRKSAKPSSTTAGEVFELEPTKDIADHPATADYPILERHVEELAKSISAIGQQEPGRVFIDSDGNEWVVKGRHRKRACQKAGVPFLYLKTTELTLNGEKCSPEEYVDKEFESSGIVKIMSQAELAIAAARRSQTYYRPRGEKRRDAFESASDEEKGASYEKAAEHFDITPNKVRNGEAIIKCTDVEKAVLAGLLNLSTAARIAKTFPGDPNASKRKQAIQAAAEKDKAKLRKLLDGGPKDDLQFDESERALLTEWDKKAKQLEVVSEWVEKVIDGNLGRLFHHRAIPTLRKLRDNIRAAKPTCRCRVCGYNANLPTANCLDCGGSGWMCQAEEDRLRAAAEEAEKEKNMRTTPIVDLSGK